MYKNIQGTHEEKFKRHKRKHISYLLTGRINIVNTSILPTAIYIFTAVSFKIPKHFSQNRKKNSTKCIKLLLFSCQVLSDSDFTDSAPQTSLSLTISQNLPKLVPIELVMPSNHLILCHPLFLLPSIFPSIRVFSNESAIHIRWPMYWSFSFSNSPSEEYMGLISFKVDWF